MPPATAPTVAAAIARDLSFTPPPLHNSELCTPSCVPEHGRRTVGPALSLVLATRQHLRAALHEECEGDSVPRFGWRSIRGLAAQGHRTGGIRLEMKPVDQVITDHDGPGAGHDILLIAATLRGKSLDNQHAVSDA